MAASRQNGTFRNTPFLRLAPQTYPPAAAERRKPYETGREHGADAFILEVMNEGGKGLNKKLGELVLGGDDVFLLGRIDRGALTW